MTDVDVASALGTLFVVATPIGNLGDLSPRAAAVLKAADLICCEDTRHTGQLLKALDVAGAPLTSLHAHNERTRVVEVLEILARGGTVALVSDAGTPLVSDPGDLLVAAAIASGAAVIAIPGPSAALAALVVSGFGGGAFRFEGFLPRKGHEREERLAAVAAAHEPSIIYEAPTRIAATVTDLERACGGARRVAIGRELTKLYEQTWRGELRDAPAADAVLARRGEYVVVVDRAANEPAEVVDLDAALEGLAAAGLSRRDAVAAVELLLGVGHRLAYDAALRLAFGDPPPDRSAGVHDPGDVAPGRSRRPGGSARPR
jgi:16S rRNA (cytidine1402-2'-O)-methyltransferase